MKFSQVKGMDNISWREEIATSLSKIAAPLMLATMAKVATEYRKNRKTSWLSKLVIVILSGCGAVVGYWLCRWRGWTEYNMTFTIFFCSLFSDKFFEYLFSKTFIDAMFTVIEDILKENLKIVLNSLNKEKK